MKALLKILLLLLLLSACGRKGALLPPEALVPAAVQDLQVQQTGEEFRISWSAPGKEKGGRPLRDLSGFKLLRRTVTADGSDCASCPDSWQLLTTVDLALPGQTVQGGGWFSYRDRGLPPGSKSQYRLLALSRSGGISSPATSPVKKLQPLVTPPGLKGAVLPAGIRLEFDFTAVAPAKLVGFNVYRRSTAKEAATLPLNSRPIVQSFWDDQQIEFGRTYRYSAAALVELEGEIVESLPSPEVELLFTQQELR